MLLNYCMTHYSIFYHLSNLDIMGDIDSSRVISLRNQQVWWVWVYMYMCLKHEWQLCLERSIDGKAASSYGLWMIHCVHLHTVYCPTAVLLRIVWVIIITINIPLLYHRLPLSTRHFAPCTKASFHEETSHLEWRYYAATETEQNVYYF